MTSSANAMLPTPNDYPLEPLLMTRNRSRRESLEMDRPMSAGSSGSANASSRIVRGKRKARLSDEDGLGEEGEGLLEGVERLGRASISESGKAIVEAIQSKKTLPTTTKSRTIPLPGTPSRPPTEKPSRGHPPPGYPPNLIRNQKYSIVSFLPLVLYEQFRFFFNLYFLLVALSQFVPALKIGFITTYIAPLAFVLSVTMGKEAFDDYQRHLRDKEANSTPYEVLHRTQSRSTIRASQLEGGNIEGGLAGRSRMERKWIPSRSIRVGDLVILEKNMRVPADMVLLRTSEGVAVDETSGGTPASEPQGDTLESGQGTNAGVTCFIRTDQLDGETDWKLRVAVPSTQNLVSDTDLLSLNGELYADPPTKDIHTFVGTVTIRPGIDPEGPIMSTTSDQNDPLTAENMLWANTVLASGRAVGIVVYTGKETRAAMNTSEPGTKVGLLDLEINRIAKTLCTVTFLLSLLLVALNGFRGQWYIYVFRFLILFSSIIPISLRVNLDMGKTIYARQIQNDKAIPGTIVRTSTLPEELGRIEYLLSDKTGTLTQNEMEMKKLHTGTIAYGWDSMDEVGTQLATAFQDTVPLTPLRAGSFSTGMNLPSRGRRDITNRVKQAVLALATCHNVTPVPEDDGTITYQASSPDEVAIVKWTETVGITLTSRDRNSMTLRDPSGKYHRFAILAVFPFTSESKRMGIITENMDSGEISFVQKGADVVMARIVHKNDWLEEECGNMAREGLRTLVIGQKRLSSDTYAAFDKQYKEAQVSLGDRNAAVSAVIALHLERDLELLTLTGVEDKLQDGLKSTLEVLRNAGLKIWMLTGDKIETAKCIAVSSKLVTRGQFMHTIAKLQTPEQASDEIDLLRTKLDACLVIDGESLQLMLDTYRTEFVQVATELPVVVACRCSPTQKADVARLIRGYTKKRVCCIGDGGNDVSMIQAADVGIGIVGKEGKQASLAADFSITQFSHLTKLLLWHGRNSYKRSAKLAQFVIHRGLIISVIQAVFSSIFFFAPIALYQGWLQVGYATLYTMAPVFSLVLDQDVNEELALLYPELYKELTKGRTLSSKTFFTWLIISIYQGGVIMIMSLLLFESEFIHIVAISFTALVLNELVMVALEVTTWHAAMVVAEVATMAIYAASMLLLPEYFDLSFVMSVRFIWKVGLTVAVSSFPLWAIKAFRSRFAPAAYVKVAQY